MGDEYPKFKAAAVQTSPVFLNREATVDKACGLIQEAARNGARLVVFPETFIPGFPYWIFTDTPLTHGPRFTRLFKEAVEIPSPATDELCRAAKAADVYLVMGVDEKGPLNMGTMWNTNVLIDPEGRILGKHRKLVPTFAEKMVWSRGDGSGMRVWQTDIGRLGTLACGENSNTLARYALLAQGEQVHVGNYPGMGGIGQNTWIQLRAGAHSCEGKVFTVVATSTVGQDIIDMLGDTEEKLAWLTSASAYSAIYGPSGEALVSIQGDEGIIYADIDIEQEIAHKQWHDIIGHYNRFDVLSLNLNQDEDQPLRLMTGRSAAGGPAEMDALREMLQQSRAEQKELRELVERLSQRLGGGEG